MNFEKLEQRLDIKFNNNDLIETAFTHRSYLNEHKNVLEHNERLEFLGDAVLELIVTEYLYKNFQAAEGDLTNWRSALVKRETLAQVAREVELQEYLKLSKGEDLSGGRNKDYILANTVEALIGAMYLDLGYETVRKFLDKQLLVKLQLILDKGLHIDSKSSFQEESQSIVGITPEYKLLKEEGPDHEKTFTIGVFLKENLIAEGSGSSKQAAEQNAAEAGLKKNKWGKYKS
jgi:ribonuclease-3